MVDGVRVTGSEKLSRRISRAIRSIKNKAVLAEIGTYLQGAIKFRTQDEHTDIFGRKFKDYSHGYKMFRQRKGYGTEVDLTLTGGMFAALRYTATDDYVRVFFGAGSSRGTDTQHPAKAFYLQEERKFFGISDEDVREILRLYQVNIGGALRGR